MIIIVEGIDRVGKTTLCNKLSAELNIPIYKHPEKIMDYSLMDNLNETDKMLQLLDVCNIVNANIIFDRFHFSDYVYGIIERNYDKQVATKYFMLLDEKLNTIDATIICMHPTDINLSSSEHGIDLLQYEQLMQYAEKISNTRLYWCNYNHIDNIVEQIKEKYNGTI